MSGTLARLIFDRAIQGYDESTWTSHVYARDGEGAVVYPQDNSAVRYCGRAKLEVAAAELFGMQTPAFDTAFSQVVVACEEYAKAQLPDIQHWAHRKRPIEELNDSRGYPAVIAMFKTVRSTL